ncbi:MAG: PTS sugar transporter subunit IIC [Elusimicrobiota bacterium]|jgi:mannose/fructose/N-acetylgalactosamine-specific phosphotransferase system component IIC|nr:PTS sugar transporter subunit IIC [Elusimicrobiota bacterium]
MIIENVVILSLIAAVFSVDMTGIGQFMLYRPIFCAPVFGYLTGDIATGLWIGMIVELIWFNAVPLGASMPPNISAISVLTIYWVNKYFPGLSAAGIFALMIAVPFGYLCREVDVLVRKINTSIMRWIEQGIKESKFERLNKGMALGAFLFFFKFFAFYLIAFPLGGLVFYLFYLHLPGFVLNGFVKAWYLLPILGLGSAVYSLISIKIFR